MMKKIFIGIVFSIAAIELYGSDHKDLVNPLYRPITIFAGDEESMKQYVFPCDEIADEIKEALRAGTPQALEVCLEGKDLTQRLDFDESPLLFAIESNKPYAISQLARAGTPIDIVNKDNKSFIDIAKERGCAEIVVELTQVEEQKKQLVISESPTTIRLSPVRFSPFAFLYKKNKRGDL